MPTVKIGLGYDYLNPRLTTLIFGYFHSLICLRNNNWRYLDDSLNVNNCRAFAKQVYPKDLMLSIASITSDSRWFFDLDISLPHCKINTRVYDKRGDVTFPIVNFPFFEFDVPLDPLYDVCISHLLRFARICNNVSDFNHGNLLVTVKKPFTPRIPSTCIIEIFHLTLLQLYRVYINIYIYIQFYTQRSDQKVSFSIHLFYGNVIHDATEFKFDTSKLRKSLKYFIPKGYDLATIVDSLRQIFFAKTLTICQ